MPYQVAVNTFTGLSNSDKIQLRRELDSLYAELTDLRAKYAIVLAKLDADGGVTDTNYAALGGLAARQFTQVV